MITNFLAPLTHKLFVGALGIALVAIGILWWSNNAKAGHIEGLQKDLAGEEARHAVTRQSVGTLEAVIADLNEQVEQRAAAFAEAQQLAEKRESELAAARRTSDAAIARLRDLARRGGQCAVPDDLRELAEGL
ncbi:MAG: hypothetical protein CMH82_02715 [Nocardioides sp.]|nr:hypothetical protein [Nocardioides sp.]